MSKPLPGEKDALLVFAAYPTHGLATLECSRETSYE